MNDDDIDYEQAAQELLIEAKQGNAESQCLLGQMYYEGIGVKQDYEQSALWFTKAAKHKHAEAQYFLGLQYQNGQGVKQNQTEAEALFQRAAKLGTVAISAQALEEKAGFTIPADRKFIAVPNNGQKEGFTIRTAEDIKKCVGKQHFFSTEKLTTLLTLFKYGGEFQTALDIMQEIFDKSGGKGHSCGLYSFDDDHIHRLGMCAPVSRCMIRQPNNRGNAGSATNGMPPTNSMGCGTWGGNIVSENITLKHYMNTTWVARPIPEDLPSLKELFGEFYQDGMDEE